MQGRFRHLFVPKKDERRLKEIEDHIDMLWKRYRSGLEEKNNKKECE